MNKTNYICEKKEDCYYKRPMTDMDVSYSYGFADGYKQAMEDTRKKNGGTYECFHCLHSNSVVWNADFDAEDFGYETSGVVHVLTCTNCGAEIQYVILDEEE